MPGRCSCWKSRRTPFSALAPARRNGSSPRSRTRELQGVTTGIVAHGAARLEWPLLSRRRSDPRLIDFAATVFRPFMTVFDGLSATAVAENISVNQPHGHKSRFFEAVRLF